MKSNYFSYFSYANPIFSYGMLMTSIYTQIIVRAAIYKPQWLLLLITLHTTTKSCVISELMLAFSRESDATLNITL